MLLKSAKKDSEHILFNLGKIVNSKHISMSYARTMQVAAITVAIRNTKGMFSNGAIFIF